MLLNDCQCLFSFDKGHGAVLNMAYVLVSQHCVCQILTQVCSKCVRRCYQSATQVNLSFGIRPLKLRPIRVDERKAQKIGCIIKRMVLHFANGSIQTNCENNCI